LRLFSLICSTFAIFIFHQIYLNCKEKLTIDDRLIALLAFATIPITLRFGDATRWYPVFTLLFSLLVATLARKSNAIWAPAVLLGALSLVNLEGYLIAAALALYRYGIERRNIFKDGKVIAAVTAFQIISLPYYYKIFSSASNSGEQSHGYSAITVLQYYRLIVGFFGGFSFGIGFAWVVLPILVVTAWALLRLIRHFREADTVERLGLMILGLTAAWATLWTYAYSFIYAALLLTYVILRSLNRSSSPAIKLTVMATFLLTGGAAIGNLRGSDHPFERTYPALYREMAEAILENFEPGDLVVSTDPNLVTMLDPRVDCVRLFSDVVRAGPRCPLRNLAAGQIEGAGQMKPPPRRVILIEGRMNLVKIYDTRDVQATINVKGPPWEEVVRQLTAGRRLVASLPYNYDADALLKTRLSGEHLSPFVFSIKIFE
jgi:hypothetical protein